ncbi:dna-binding protein hgh1 [Diplodia corticola]|uniref:Protein HGH1 homolog n=1 Tax=Diplodia corticola TaxID=236234 RepID=A0A1J9SIV2_9PEZI|nr:dna-binding protein hgh1 [Diplodia corticola]OJD40287.1 dna-binding protein hgh1 [Diplodia corticola]
MTQPPLVEFLHHGNTQIRQIAAENLVGYTTAQPSLFKRNQLEPIKDLKLLVKDYTAISKNALTMLINLTDDDENRECLAKDDAFLESLLLRITSSKEPNANEIAMLFANLAKSDSLKRILTLERAVPKDLSTSKVAMDQLMDCFVKGAEGRYNKHADYDYLSYLFADMAKHAEGRAYLTTPQARDADIIPITKLTVFTEHRSTIRRRGAANTIKNVCFEIDAHMRLLDADGVNILPYLLLPLMGGEEYADEDTEGMLDEVQLLPPDKQREPENDILKTHLETLLLLCTTREARDELRRVKVYPIVRETHLHVEDDEVREAVDRVVQIIMRKEEGEEDDMPPPGGNGAPQITEAGEEDEDEQVVTIL